MKKIFIIIQFLLTLVCLVLGCLYLFGNKGLLSILEIAVGCDLIFTGISNYLIHENKKILLIYLIVGVIIIMIVVLSMLGVI